MQPYICGAAPSFLHCVQQVAAESCSAPECCKDCTERRVGLHGNSQEPKAAFPRMPWSSTLLTGNCLPAGKDNAHPPVFTAYSVRHKVEFPELLSALQGAPKAACPILCTFSLALAFHGGVLLPFALGVPYYILLSSLHSLSCSLGHCP